MKSKTLPFLATLIRGNVYFLGNTRFDVDQAVPVTKAQRDRLEEDAVDIVNAEGGETFTKPKFEFDVNPDYEEPAAILAAGTEGTGGPVIEGLDTDLDDEGGTADEPVAGADSQSSGAGTTKPATRAAARRGS